MMIRKAIVSDARVCRLRSAGFTLVELLAVTLIMAMLAGIVVGLSGYAARRASESQVQADLQLLRNALEEYRLNLGSYPQHNIVNEPQWLSFQATVHEIAPRVAADLVFEDAWGAPYQYINHGRFSFDLYSHGPSGSGTDYDRIR